MGRQETTTTTTQMRMGSWIPPPPVHVVLVVIRGVVVQHQHEVFDVQAPRRDAGGHQDATDVALEVGDRALPVALVLAAVQAQAGVAVLEQVTEQSVALLLRCWQVTTGVACCPWLWSWNTASALAGFPAHLALHKDEDLALLVPLPQYLQQPGEALLLGPYLDNLLNVRVDDAAASDLLQQVGIRDLNLTARAPSFTWISTGSWRILRASVSTCRGKVALKRTVCLSGRMFCTILMICGSNPMSNMRSASSSTRYVTRRRLVILPLEVTSRSIMRPGVHTTTSVPRFSSLIWLATPEPPNTATTERPRGLANFLISCGKASLSL